MSLGFKSHRIANDFGATVPAPHLLVFLIHMMIEDSRIEQNMNRPGRFKARGVMNVF